MRDPDPDRDQVPLSHRFVAGPDTSRRLAGAFVRYSFAQPRLWVFHVLVLGFFTMVFTAGVGAQSLGAAARLGRGSGYALVATAVVAAVVAATTYRRARREGRVRLHGGAVLESGFGDGAVVLKSEEGSSRVGYPSIRSVTTYGDFVFVLRHGDSSVSAWPRELFPDDALEAMRSASGGSPSQAEDPGR